MPAMTNCIDVGPNLGEVIETVVVCDCKRARQRRLGRVVSEET